MRGRSMRAAAGAAGTLLALALAGAAQAARIEGAGERYRFEPGDRVLFQTRLAACPVGEYAEGVEVPHGAYECARFQDRIWIRPLEGRTVMYVRLPEPLPPEFSLEFPVWAARDGCAYTEFRLHAPRFLEEIERDPYARGRNALLGGVVGCDGAAFGAQRTPGEVRFDVGQTRLEPERVHRIAVQVRRGQVRFFVDGRRVAYRPFRPQAPIAALSFWFHRRASTATSYADAPVLVGDIRIAAYSRPEPRPEAEKDLMRELGAVETPEGVKVTLSEAILFDLGRWDLKPGARQTLEKLARLAGLRRGTVRVEGHTDDVGPERFNQVLSELRAHVVALELARLGVDPKRLRPKGFGETRPVAPNDSDANRARNRRVEVILAR